MNMPQTILTPSAHSLNQIIIIIYCIQPSEMQLALKYVLLFYFKCYAFALIISLLNALTLYSSDNIIGWYECNYCWLISNLYHGKKFIYFLTIVNEDSFRKNQQFSKIL